MLTGIAFDIEQSLELLSIYQGWEWSTNVLLGHYILPMLDPSNNLEPGITQVLVEVLGESNIMTNNSL